MSRISHHLRGKDYKKTHQRKLDEQIILSEKIRREEIEEQGEKEEIAKLSAPFKSSWRKDINEGMTTSSIYITGIEDIPGDPGSPAVYARMEKPYDVLVDSSPTDTSGLFADDGVVLSVEPTGDTSYVLGPMISYYYTDGDYTQIGYVDRDNRKFTALGRISGTLNDWDGSSNFTSYGNLTLDQALWYKNQPKSPDGYHAFYDGPAPDGTSDENGRIPGVIVRDTKNHNYRQTWSLVKTLGLNPGDPLYDIFVGYNDHPQYIKYPGGSSYSSWSNSDFLFPALPVGWLWVTQTTPSGYPQNSVFTAAVQKSRTEWYNFYSSTEPGTRIVSSPAIPASPPIKRTNYGGVNDMNIPGLVNIPSLFNRIVGREYGDNKRKKRKEYYGPAFGDNATANQQRMDNLYDYWKNNYKPAQQKQPFDISPITANDMPGPVKDFANNFPDYRKTEWGQNLDRLQNDPVWGPIINAGVSAAGMAIGKGAPGYMRRGMVNPLGQRATVRSGAAGRAQVPVYRGRSYQGDLKIGGGGPAFGTVDPKVAGTYTQSGPLRGTPGTAQSPQGTVDRGTLPQRYIDKYGGRSVLGQQQIKMSPSAAARTFGGQVTPPTSNTNSRLKKVSQVAAGAASAAAALDAGSAEPNVSGKDLNKRISDRLPGYSIGDFSATGKGDHYTAPILDPQGNPVINPRTGKPVTIGGGLRGKNQYSNSALGTLTNAINDIKGGFADKTGQAKGSTKVSDTKTKPVTKTASKTQPKPSTRSTIKSMPASMMGKSSTPTPAPAPSPQQTLNPLQTNPYKMYNYGTRGLKNIRFGYEPQGKLIAEDENVKSRIPTNLEAEPLNKDQRNIWKKIDRHIKNPISSTHKMNLVNQRLGGSAHFDEVSMSKRKSMNDMKWNPRDFNQDSLYSDDIIGKSESIDKKTLSSFRKEMLKPEFPNEPPPKTVNGYHPDLVDGKKVADRFNRLDPISAKAMPLTGNPHIDKKVLKARNQPK